MDLIKKCHLISDNILINNNGYGYDYELNLELFTELKNEITEKLESLIDPIIEEYKNRRKKLFCQDYGIDIDLVIDEKLDLLTKSMNSHTEINRYIQAIKIIEKEIAESRKKTTTRIEES